MSSIIKVNTYQDANGNALFSSDGSGNITGNNLLTPAFEAYLSANQTISDLTATKIQFDTEVFDTDNAYDNATNYRFTPQVAGKYYVYSSIMMQSTTGTFDISQFNIDLKKNGSSLRLLQQYINGATHYNITSFIHGSVDMNGSTDYLEIFVTTRSSTSASSRAVGNTQESSFGAYKIIGA